MNHLIASYAFPCMRLAVQCRLMLEVEGGGKENQINGTCKGNVNLWFCSRNLNRKSDLKTFLFSDSVLRDIQQTFEDFNPSITFTNEKKTGFVWIITRNCEIYGSHSAHIRITQKNFLLTFSSLDLVPHFLWNLSRIFTRWWGNLTRRWFFRQKFSTSIFHARKSRSKHSRCYHWTLPPQHSPDKSRERKM